jgi:hypothetical protein
MKHLFTSVRDQSTSVKQYRWVIERVNHRELLRNIKSVSYVPQFIKAQDLR